MRGGRLRLVSLLAAACTRPRTEIMLVLETDFMVPGELASIGVHAELEGGRENLDQTYEVDGSTVWPISLGLVPEKGKENAGLRVVVEGRKGTERVVQQSARTAFVEGKTLVLRMGLLRICDHVLDCPDGQTCRHPGERCSSDTISTSELPPYAGLPGKPDATPGGSPPDGGPGADSGAGDVPGVVPDAAKAGDTGGLPVDMAAPGLDAVLPDAAYGLDAMDALVAPPRRCDPAKPFGVPVLVPNINGPGFDDGADLADDELTLYFGSGGTFGALYVATRPSAADSFAKPQFLFDGSAPRLTRDQLKMYYVLSNDIYVTSRSSVAAVFAPGVAVGGVNSPLAHDGEVWLWRDSEAMYLTSERPGSAQSDIYVSTRAGDGSYGPPQPVAGVNSAAYETRPVVTWDGLTIYFSSNRNVEQQRQNIWRATRLTTSDAFGNPEPVPELNRGPVNLPNWISPDGCKFYLSSSRSGGPIGPDITDIYEASRGL